MLNIAIAEDDPNYAKQIEAYIAQYEKDGAIEIKVSTFTDGVEILEKYQRTWDIIFLDIDMPNLDGISAAKEIRRQDASVIIIFITNLARYAIRGYEVDALDFILKPVSYEQFFMKMKKAVAISKQKEHNSVLLQTRENWVSIPVNEIIYIEVKNHHLKIITTQESYTIYDSLNHFEKGLPAEQFCRCSQSYLVNLHHIRCVQQNTVAVDQYELTISRTWKKKFLQAVSDFFGRGYR